MKYDFTKHLLEDLDYPLSLKKYERYLDHYEHNKGYVNDIHDLIRKLTLSIFGVTLNSDLSEDEYEEAATMYRNLKKYYLYLYEQRMSKLSLDDFE
ncbi:hypothetical phage-related protein [Staphylococcus muscae]|uniref:Hypothetical phage-related protein n=1 Tax=Staphylococcus muscae TaxID=1294 RepID=A0A240BY00_9STAP|nr:hypothetical protein GCM10007183_17170 [Staphylococcus muscae]SNW00545.1 hypothetical phage-related protein [Staphylococcus muscae]